MAISKAPIYTPENTEVDSDKANPQKFISVPCSSLSKQAEPSDTKITITIKSSTHKKGSILTFSEQHLLVEKATFVDKLQALSIKIANSDVTVLFYLYNLSEEHAPFTCAVPLNKNDVEAFMNLMTMGTLSQRNRLVMPLRIGEAITQNITQCFESILYEKEIMSFYRDFCRFYLELLSGATLSDSLFQEDKFEIGKGDFKYFKPEKIAVADSLRDHIGNVAETVETEEYVLCYDGEMVMRYLPDSYDDEFDVGESNPFKFNPTEEEPYRDGSEYEGVRGSIGKESLTVEKLHGKSDDVGSRNNFLKTKMSMKETVFRVRFHANSSDYRPVKWPIKYPYWCVGYEDNRSILIALVDDLRDIETLWPEAENLDPQVIHRFTFSKHFPKPEWFDETKVNIPTRDLQKE